MTTYQFLGELSDCLVRILVGVGVNVGLVSGERVEQWQSSSVGLDDAEAGFRGVVGGDTAVLLPVKVANLLLVRPALTAPPDVNHHDHADQEEEDDHGGHGSDDGGGGGGVLLVPHVDGVQH